MKNYREITYRYLLGQRKRTILTVVGIILSVALITGMGTLLIGFREFEVRKTARSTGDYYARFSNVESSQAARIIGAGEVSNAAVTVDEGLALLAGVSDLKQAADQNVPPARTLRLAACDKNCYAMFYLHPEEGRLPAAPGELMVDYGVLEYLPGHPRLGDRVMLDVGAWYAGQTPVPERDYKWQGNEVFRKQSTREFTIVGLARPRIESSSQYSSTGFLYLDPRRLKPVISCDVYVKTTSAVDVVKKAEDIARAAGLAKQKDAGGLLKYPISYNNTLLRLSAQSTDDKMNKDLIKIVGFIALLVVICTIAVIYNAFNISVLERVSQFGLLRCVGATPGQIRAIVFKEAAILCVLGIPPGLVSGVLAMKVLMAVINSFGSNALNLFEDMPIEASFPVLAISALLGLLTVFLSAMGPALKAGKVPPIEAVRNVGSYLKEDFSKVRRSSPGPSFIDVEGQIAFKNLRRNRGRFRITVFSMAISIVLFIVFGSFVNYMFTMGAVDAPPNADLMLSAKGVNSIADEQYQKIKDLPGVEKAFKNMETSVAIEVEPQKVNPRFASLKPDLFNNKKGDTALYPKGTLVSYGSASATDLQKILKQNNLESMNRQKGVIVVAVNKVYDPARRKSVIAAPFNCRVGDDIRISSVPGDRSTGFSAETVKVMGIIDKSFVDNGYNRNGEVYLITTEEVYQQLIGNKIYRQMAIKLRQGADPAPAAAYLKDLVQKEPIYDYTDFAEMAAGMRTAALTASIFLYGFVAVITLIGSLNIINTISTNLILRTRELSVLRAVGMTQTGIKRMVALEGTLYGIIAAVYGSIIGTGLVYLLYRLISSVEEFPWIFPWTQISIAALGAVIIALVSGYIPLKRINNGVIVENIRMVE